MCRICFVNTARPSWNSHEGVMEHKFTDTCVSIGICYMVRRVVNNGHQKDMFYNEIELCAQIACTSQSMFIGEIVKLQSTCIRRSMLSLYKYQERIFTWIS